MPIYMLLEGRRYWPPRLRAWMIDREKKRLQTLKQIVEDRDKLAGDPEAAVEYACFPVTEGGDAYAEYPTQLGNLITSHETYPMSKYGINGVFYWHRPGSFLTKTCAKK
jgi:hypothetical protein